MRILYDYYLSNIYVLSYLHTKLIYNIKVSDHHFVDKRDAFITIKKGKKIRRHKAK